MSQSMPKYGLYNYNIDSDVIVCDFVASLNYFQQNTMNILKDCHENYRICSKNQMHNFWVWLQNRMVLETMYKFMSCESSLKPCSYHKPVNAKIWSLQFVD